jgi:hypothetical protein
VSGKEKLEKEDAESHISEDKVDIFIIVILNAH